MSTLNRTIYPELVSNYFGSNIALLSAYTSFLNLTEQYINEVSTYISYVTASSQCDFVSAGSNFFIQQNQTFPTLDNEFVDYWITKYNNSVTTIQQIVSSTITANDYYQQYSDSIGIIANSIYVLTESVLPVFDITMTEYAVPYTYPAPLNNKISSNSALINSTLSQKTTYVFRKNIQNILIQDANSTQAHGFNLVTDFQHLVRTQNALSNLTTTLSNNFNNIYNLITFYANINNNTGYNPQDALYNLQQIQPIVISINVEGKTQLVDLLGKKIKAVRDVLTIKQVLDAS